MNILACCPMPYMDIQTELHKAFVYTLGILSKRHKITLLFDQKKKYKKYLDNGWIKYLEDKNIKILYVGTILKNYNNETKTFDVDYSFLDSLESNYDELFIYGSPLCSEKTIGEYSYKKYDTKVRCTFMSMKSKYNSYIIINSIINKYKINIKHQIIDYLEPKFKNFYENCITYANYKDKEKGYRTMYLFENYLFRKGYILNEKIYELYFGYSVSYFNRKYLSEFIQKKLIENDKFKISCKDKFWGQNGRNDTVNQTEYYDLISKSKFSLLAPSNDINEVSYIRLLECLSRKCIPIILSNVKIERCLNNFKDILEFYKSNNLIYNINEKITINEFIKNLDYNKLINDLCNLNTLKKFNSRGYMKKLLINKYERG